MRLRPALGRLAVAACVAALAAPYAVATVRTPAVGLSVLRPAAAQSPGDRSRDDSPFATGNHVRRQSPFGATAAIKASVGERARRRGGATGPGDSGGPFGGGL